MLDRYTAPHDAIETGTVRALAIFRRLAVSMLFVIGATVFLAWIIPPLARFMPPHWTGMKANTAFLILLSTTSLLLSKAGRRRWQSHLGRAIGIAIFVLALLIFLEFLNIHIVPIDTVFSPDARGIVPGRMSIQAAIGFMLLGLTFTLLGIRSRAVVYVSDILSMLLCLFLLSFVGSSFFTKEGLPGWSLQEQLSPQTFFCIALLVLLVLHRRTDRGMFQILVQKGIGGRTARWAAPVAVLLPILMASLRDVLVRLHLLTLNYAIAIAPAITSVLALYFVLMLSRRNRDLERALHDLSLRDELTGLYNRRGFHLLAEQALLESQRTHSGFSIVFFDVDNLKVINDSLGHDDGSRLLRNLADELRLAFRATDIIGRVGGDEFVVAAKSGLDGIQHALDRLARAMQLASLDDASLTYSYGLASLQDPQHTLADLIEQADERMYASKRNKKAEIAREA